MATSKPTTTPDGPGASSPIPQSSPAFPFPAKVWNGAIEDVTTYCDFHRIKQPHQQIDHRSISAVFSPANISQSLTTDSHSIEGKISPVESDCLSIEDEISIVDPATMPHAVLRTGRGLACSCFRNNYWSITIRGKNDKYKGPGHTQHPVYDPFGQLRDLSAQLKNHGSFENKYKPSDSPEADGKPSKFLFSFANICEEIKDLILQPQKEIRGLIVIAGSTSSGKSEVARGLIHYYLDDLIKTRRIEVNTLLNENNGKTPEELMKSCKVRRPHLLTLENPIEKYLWENGDRNFEPPDQTQYLRGIDYTPRQLKVDTPSLREALLQDALRQTPSVVYVGETRSSEEWKSIVEFAGTGHLVITTAHANSVVETMEKILMAVGAKTPQERGQIAQRIKAVIHLAPLTYKISTTEKNAYQAEVDRAAGQEPLKAEWSRILNREGGTGIVPAIWRGTPGGVAALVADGLASILPNKITDNREPYCIGRTWFFEKLLKRQTIKWSKSNFQLAEALNSDLRGI